MSADPYSPIRAATCRVDGSGMNGTGFLVAPGRIVTCRHVVAKETAESLRLTFVWTQDGAEMQEEEIYPVLSMTLASEGGSDLALLEIEPVATSARQPLRLGQAVLGRPFLCWGYPGLTSESVQCGLPNYGDVISRTGTASQPRFALKTSMTIKAGDSGSPVVQTAPLRVVGVISQNIDPGDEGIAVPAEQIEPIFPRKGGWTLAAPTPNDERFAVPAEQLEPSFPRKGGWTLIAPTPGGVEDPTPLRWKGNARRASRTFVGRQADMVRLDRQLAGGDRVAVQAAISGLAGIGKTELALQYLRHGADPLRFPGGWIWLDASQDLAGQWAQMAPEVGIQSGTMEPRQLAPAVLHRMESRPRTLLVLDNAESWNELQVVLPSEESGHALLVTTRERDFGGAQFAGRLDLGVLSAAEARELLQKTMGARAEKHPEDVDLLVEALAGHALALEVAGAYLGRHPRIRAEEMAGGRPKSIRKRDLEGIQYGATFSGMLEELLARLAQENPAAGRLVPLLGLFGEAPAPVDLLTEVWEEVVEGEGDLDAALELLIAIHLLDRVGLDGWTTHRLIRSEARTLLGLKQNFGNQARVALSRQLVQRLVDLADFDLAGFASLRPHIDEVARWDQHSIEQAEVLRAATRLTWLQGHFRIGASWLKQAITIFQTLLGPTEPLVIQLLSDLSLHLYHSGEVASADLEIRKALRSGELVFGKDHVAVALFRSNHGIILTGIGTPAALEEARSEAETALRIDLIHLGPKHVKIAVDRSLLAQIHARLGDLDLAKKEAEAALGIALEVEGPAGSTAVSRRVILSEILMTRGEFQAARHEVEEAIRFHSDWAIEGDLFLASARAHLAAILLQLGDVAAARQEAIEVVRLASLDPGRSGMQERIVGLWQAWLAKNPDPGNEDQRQTGSTTPN